jgi:hypothetical protein
MITAAVADAVTDDRAAIQAVVNAAIAVAGDGFVVVDGDGKSYAISGPVVLGTGVRFQNFKLIALPSAAWTVANAMLESTTGYNILIDAVYFDAAKQAKNCFINTQQAFIRMSHCRATRFLNKGYWIKGDISMLDCQAQQFSSSDPDYPSAGNGYSFAAVTGYPLWLSDAASDSKLIGCIFALGVTSVYIDYGVHHIQFIGCHIFNGVTGSGRANCKNVEIHGYRIQFVGCYFDLGAIWFYRDGTNNHVDLLITGCISLYSAASATFPAWVVITTNVAGSQIEDLHVGDNQWSGDGAIPDVAMQVTGTGSWAASPSGQSGLWSPALKFGGNSAGMLYEEPPTGRFSKSADGMVFATGSIKLDAKGSSTGLASVVNLPHLPSGNAPPGGGRVNNYAGMVGFNGADMEAAFGSDNCYFRIPGATGITGANHTNFTDNSFLRFWVIYHTDE